MTKFLSAEELHSLLMFSDQLITMVSETTNMGLPNLAERLCYSAYCTLRIFWEKAPEDTYYEERTEVSCAAAIMLAGSGKPSACREFLNQLIVTNVNDPDRVEKFSLIREKYFGNKTHEQPTE